MVLLWRREIELHYREGSQSAVDGHSQILSCAKEGLSGPACTWEVPKLRDK